MTTHVPVGPRVLSSSHDNFGQDFDPGLLAGVIGAVGGK
jgi:hypothetical protein